MAIKTFLDSNNKTEQTLGSITLTAKDVADTLNVNTLLTRENKKLKKELDFLKKEIIEIKKKI